MASIAATRTIDPQWFATWFDSIHYQRLYAHRDEHEAASFIDHLVAKLRPSKGAEVLDLGCGTGRHARRLAAWGLRVTGIDLARNSIRAAKPWENSCLRFWRHDMREPFGRTTFDHVFNFFTSFGYFHQQEHLQVIRNMANALKSGGTLLLDYLNTRFSENHLVKEEARTVEGTSYRLSRWSDDRHLYKKIVVETAAGERSEHMERIAKFEVGDFQSMFSQYGLRVSQVFGDYDFNAFEENDSPRMMLLATKDAA